MKFKNNTNYILFALEWDGVRAEKTPKRYFVEVIKTKRGANKGFIEVFDYETNMYGMIWIDSIYIASEVVT